MLLRTEVARGEWGGVLLEVELVEASAHTLEVFDSIGLADGTLGALTVRLEVCDTGEACEDGSGCSAGLMFIFKLSLGPKGGFKLLLGFIFFK